MREEIAWNSIGGENLVTKIVKSLFLFSCFRDYSARVFLKNSYDALCMRRAYVSFAPTGRQRFGGGPLRIGGTARGGVALLTRRRRDADKSRPFDSRCFFFPLSPDARIVVPDVLLFIFGAFFFHFCKVDATTACETAATAAAEHRRPDTAKTAKEKFPLRTKQFSLSSYK